MNNTQLQCKPQHDVVLFFREDPNLQILLTVLYSCLIPLIICGNLLLIIGIIKIKRIKFTLNQILFLILSLSDLIIGVVQLPFLIYLLWKTSDLTCFEARLRAFSTSFPIILSGTLLCAISVDRYIYVASNQYYKRIITKKSVPASIIFIVLLISLTWVLFETLNQNEADIKTIAKGYIIAAGYFLVSTVVGVTFYIALLRYVQRKTKNFARHQPVYSNLTKTIVIIILLMIVAYLPLIVALNIVAYGSINSADKSFIQERANVRLTMIPCQVNAVLNSVIYLTRSSRMKRYYYKLFNCKTVGKCFKRAVSPVSNITQNSYELRQIHSVHAVKAISRKNDL